jgi:hypothetical protein
VIKRTVTYTDADGQKHVEDLYFHLYAMDIAKLEGSQKGGIHAIFTEMMKAGQGGDTSKAVKLFRKIISISYGVRDDDGKFQHKKKWSKAFMQSAACDAFLLTLMDGTGKAAEEFQLGILPEGYAEQVKSVQNSGGDDPPWIKEDRAPTKKELAAATPEQLARAWQARDRRKASQE